MFSFQISEAIALVADPEPPPQRVNEATHFVDNASSTRRRCDYNFSTMFDDGIPHTCSGQCLRNVPTGSLGGGSAGQPHEDQSTSQSLLSHVRGQGDHERGERVQRQHQHVLQWERLQRERSEFHLESASQVQSQARLVSSQAAATCLRRLYSVPPSPLVPLRSCQLRVAGGEDGTCGLDPLWDGEGVCAEGGEEEEGDEGGGGQPGLPPHQQAAHTREQTAAAWISSTSPPDPWLCGR